MQLSSDRKRKLETADILESPFSSLLKKKSKKEEKKEAKKELKRATEEGEFQPYDYEKVDYDKLLKGELFFNPEDCIEYAFVCIFVNLNVSQT